ncbi:MAG: putative rane-bound dehydrogenase [Gemmataceae bacterium]|nr:putative rane-bound dehydrogenase [Gemmataceae bacterium]
MTLLRPARAFLLPAVMAALAFLAPAEAYSQKAKKVRPTGPAEDLLKPGPRPKRPPLPPSRLPLELIKGERIALIGNSTAERMSLFGHFETQLHLRFADKELVVRNFGRPAEEVSVHQRSADYTKLDDPLHAFGPDTFLCFFGYNESFAGKEGVETFKTNYEKLLDEYAERYPRDDTRAKPRFVIVSPIAFESAGDPFLPDGKKENANLKLYADAAKAVADKRGLAFVDLYDPTLKAFAEQPGLQLTVNGCHANEVGDKLIGETLSAALFGPAAGPANTAQYEKVRAAVNDKSFVHQQDYRMVNGWYVYGGRRTFDTDTFPREYVKLRNMAAVRDRYVWDIAQGKEVAAKPDDSETGDLITPPTRFGDPRQKYSEADQLRYLSPDEFIKTCTTPPGVEIKLFADEKMFPELAKPVQLNFDNKGRLWVACMPNYPQWKPGDPKPNDRLLTLEDTDGDGKADKCTVFYDQLHCPTGFEFWNGGVLVMDQPRILWLKDTDGDGKADLVVQLWDGWATDDTHHRGGWEWSPGGKLHLLEGIATSTTLETPWGPHHSHGSGGAYVIDPRSLKVRQFSLPGMYNMWCYVFDEWGQGIVGDGTTPNQTWDVPLSGAQFPGRKGLNFILPDGVRPNLGSEWLVSRNLPDEMQRQFTYACVIQMNGLTRYTVEDDGAGYKGQRIKKDGQFSDLIRSTDKHFRPSDPQIGPDGALWFGDWANALIGHMQYSQRDPNRDHQRGRIYRLVGKDKPLVKPVTQFGKSVPELLEQFREYEWRTRYRARRELRDRPTPEVTAAVKAWVAKLEPADKAYDRLLCEALWVQQGHHAVDPELLKQVLGSKRPEARAAAVHVVAEERETVPAAFDLLKTAATDAHPRVRTEALRGLSFYATPEAVDAALAAAKLPLDYWTKYTLDATLGATETVWRPGFLAGKLGKGNPAGEKIMTDILSSSKAGGAAAPHLRLLLGTETQTAETKNKAMTELTKLKGDVNNGRAVFVRSCTACHKVGNGEGQEYGPNLAEVGKRLTRYKIVESMIDPNAEVEAKYASTRIVTVDGKTIVGLVVRETKKEVVIFDGKEKKTIPVDEIDTRTVLKQSSMPEGQAAAMSPAEFVDLIEYLSAQK